MAPDERSSSPNDTKISIASVTILNRVFAVLANHSLEQTATDTSAPAELSSLVDELLNSLSNKFAGVSSEIFAKSTASMRCRAAGPKLIP